MGGSLIHLREQSAPSASSAAKRLVLFDTLDGSPSVGEAWRDGAAASVRCSDAPQEAASNTRADRTAERMRPGGPGRRRDIARASFSLRRAMKTRAAGGVKKARAAA